MLPHCDFIPHPMLPVHFMTISIALFQFIVAFCSLFISPFLLYHLSVPCSFAYFGVFSLLPYIKQGILFSPGLPLTEPHYYSIHE